MSENRFPYLMTFVGRFTFVCLHILAFESRWEVRLNEEQETFCWMTKEEVRNRKCHYGRNEIYFVDWNRWKKKEAVALVIEKL